jgi:opacity protein-like surface antigen
MKRIPSSFFIGTGSLIAALVVEAAEPRLYVNVEAGPSFLHDVDIKNSGGAEAEFDVGVRSGVAVGYQFTGSWAGEFETGLTWNSVDKIGAPVPPPPGGGGYAAYQRGDADLYQIPFLANVVYTIPLEGRCSPYVGAGIGGVASGLDASFPAGDVEDTDFTFAGQAFVGVRCALTDRVDLGAAYKFMGTTDHHWSEGRLDVKTRGIFTHAVVAALTIHF